MMGANLSPRFDTFGQSLQKISAIRLNRNWRSHAPPAMLFIRRVTAEFEPVLIRTPNENSVLTLEAPEKRESESSGPFFRTGGCNLEGCVREAEISLQTESAAV